MSEQIDPRRELAGALRSFVLARDTRITLDSKRLVTRMLLELWMVFPEISPAPPVSTIGDLLANSFFGRRLLGA